MIYFITCREVGCVKIGRAANPQERAHSAQVGCPLDLTLERVCEGGKEDEAALHARFASARHRGEWFTITPEIEAHMATLPRHVWRHRGCQHEARRAAAAAKAA